MPYNHYAPQNLPLNSNQKIIAPYWADVDLRGIGCVFYRQTDDPVLVAKANSDIRAAFPASENVTISNLLIVTWDFVGYYPRKRDKVRVVHTTVYMMCASFFQSNISIFLTISNY